MMERLAELAQRRGRRVVIIAAIFFLVAGALGAGVADRLDPYGADDPDTESVRADERLESAGFRDTGVVILIEDVDVRSAEGRERVGAIADELAANHDVAEVSSFVNTRSPDFVSSDGDSTYV